MKTCPSCQTQYTDDTLLYCLQDGTPLVGGSQSDVKTEVYGETETLVNSRPADLPRETVRDLKYPTATGAPHKKKGSRFILAAAVVAALVVLILGGIGIGAFFYLKNRDSTSKNTDRTELSNKSSGRKDGSPTPSGSPTIIPTPAASSSPASSARLVDRETRDEVLAEIDNWRETTESFDLDTLMSHYAPRVDYYTRRGASVDFIRNDKNRAFSQFDEIEMKLSNFDVSQTSSNKITVLFDKSWRFRGDRSSTGKVRQLLELSRIDGTWLITAERDVKVY